MKKIFVMVVAAASALALGACGGGANSGSGVENANEQENQNENEGGNEQEGSTEEETPVEEVPDGDGETYCTVTHFTSGDESRFRVQGLAGEDVASDCVKCPGPTDVVKLTYTGNGFEQSLEFNGALTNGSGAASDELILEQSGNVCWSEDYDAGGDLPSASALTVDGHASTIEFDKGPDVAGPSGTLRYYRNDVLQFAIPVVEGGELAAYPDDGVQLK